MITNGLVYNLELSRNNIIIHAKNVNDFSPVKFDISKIKSHSLEFADDYFNGFLYIEILDKNSKSLFFNFAFCKDGNEDVQVIVDRLEQGKITHQVA